MISSANLLFMIEDLAIRHFLALQAVAEERSFGRAAERLGFTQSAISQQIAAFERAIGQPLFDRPGGPRQIELTPIGTLMLRHAEQILGHLNTAEEELAHLLAGVGGRLSIGTFQSITVKVLPEVIGQMRSTMPNLEIRLTESTSNEELITLLIDGAVDVAFIVAPANDSRLVLTPIGTDPFVVLAPASDCRDTTITLDELSCRPLIGNTDDDGCQRVINQYLWSADTKPNFAFRSDDNAAVQAMVRVGMGSAVMPYLAIDANDPDVRVLEMSPPLPPRQLFAAQRAERTLAPAATKLIELASEVVAELEKARKAQSRSLAASIKAG